MASPEINFAGAKVLLNQEIASGSRLMRIKADKQIENYQPGHVFGLKIANPSNASAELKHAYTVARADNTRGTVDIVYRVIPNGKMTPILSTLKPGTPVQFGGKFHNPIIEEVSKDCNEVVAICTGSGVGPILGFVEQAMADEGRGLSVRAYCGYRRLQDAAFVEEMEEISEAWPGRFRFHLCISELEDDRYPLPMGYQGLRGRVTQAVPRHLSSHALTTSHFHLVGNGAMISTMRSALLLAAVPESHVTSEAFFNFRAPADEETARRVAKGLLEQTKPAAEWAGAPS